MSLYAKYVKTHLSELLGAMGLDVQYQRAFGTRLYHADGAGPERSVLDLLGGYGSLIWGHNHPELCACAQAFLASQGPIHAQLSLRERSGELAARLSQIAQRDSGGAEEFKVVFSNSGAEAVEAAIKHAELERVLRLEALLEQIQANVERVRAAVRRGEAEIPADIYQHGELREQLPEVRGIEELLAGLVSHNGARLQRRPVFLLLERSFHGKLIGSVQLTFNRNFRRPFQFLGLKARFVPMDRPDLLAQVVAEERVWLLDLAIERGRVQLVERELPIFSACVVEPIQGEGGVHCLSAEFARELRRTCNELGCPLIVDEIQSGMGRAGSFFASSLIGLRGDYYTLSKSLGGGIVKLAATLIRSARFRREFELIHSSTFAEDDLSASVGLQVLDLLECDGGAAYARIRERGERLRAALERVQQRFPDVIREVRGKGLFLGVELQPLDHAASVTLRSTAYTGSSGYLVSGYLLREHAIRVAPTGSASNVLRLEPALSLSDAEIEHVERALDTLCRVLRQQDALHLVFPLTRSSRPKPRAEIGDFRPPLASEPPPAAEGGRPVRKVAFINHLISPAWLGHADPSLAELDVAESATFVRQMAKDKRTAPYPPVRIRSRLGAAVDFILYPLCVCSEQMTEYIARGELDGIREDIEERLVAARRDGCEVAGLGMYTSIVTNNCTSLQTSDIALTSGNALTIAMGIRAIERALAERALDPGGATLAVVGAAGNIASTYAAMLGSQVARVLLIGSGRRGAAERMSRTQRGIYEEACRQLLHDPRGVRGGLCARLLEESLIQGWLSSGAPPESERGQRIVEHLCQRYGADPFVQIAGGEAAQASAVADAQIVLCAANSATPIFGPGDFREGAIVCDIAVPNNVHEGIGQARPDLTYLLGGIVATPHGESLHPTARAFLQPGQLFACMAETAVLGLAGIKGHYSYGAILPQQVSEIMTLAEAHGFTLADYRGGNSL